MEPNRSVVLAHLALAQRRAALQQKPKLPSSKNRLPVPRIGYKNKPPNSPAVSVEKPRHVPAKDKAGVVTDNINPAAEPPKPKTAFDVMKAADSREKPKVKKMTKKAPKSRPDNLEQSSLCFEQDQQRRAKPQRKTAKVAVEKLSEVEKSPDRRDKENAGANSGSPMKAIKLTTKTYVKRNVSKVSFDQSVPVSPPKKVKKQEAKLNEWAALQNSCFSEVDDFDLSFS